MDLSTQQIGQLAADGKSEAGAAILSFGGTVYLLERFENNTEFLLGNANTGIVNGER
jgi:hypothetical protein